MNVNKNPVLGKKKVKKDKTLPKYLFGGEVNLGEIESPGTALTDNQIRMARAEQEAANNPWTQGLDIFGSLAMQVGSSMMSKGQSQGGSMGDVFSGMFGTTKAAMGGIMGEQINAEGNELIETPDGVTSKLQGPSHNEGGIDMLVPPNTKIYSKQLLGPDGVSMADRKEKREKAEKKLEKLFSKSPGDVTLKTTLQRVKENNQKEEEQDIQKMQKARYMMEGLEAMRGAQQFLVGGIAGDPEPDPTTPWAPYDYMEDKNFVNYVNGFLNEGASKEGSLENTEETEKSFLDNIFGSVTIGDGIGMAGNLVSTFGPAKNTRANRAGDTPNINAFKNYGKDGLKALDKAKGYIRGQQDESLKELELARTGATSSARNSARGVNTLRALDSSVNNSVNTQKGKIKNAYAREMMRLFGMEGMMENEQDKLVMAGEQTRDDADRRDRDNYFTNMAQNISTKGTGIQQIGKTINQMKTREVTSNIMKELFPNFKFGRNGNAEFVPDEIIENGNNYARIKDETLREKAYNNTQTKGWKWEDNILYNAEGQEIDETTLKPIE